MRYLRPSGPGLPAGGPHRRIVRALRDVRPLGAGPGARAWYAAGAVLEGYGDPLRAARMYGRGLARDEHRTEREERLLAGDPTEFLPRVRVHRFVRARLDEIRSRALERTEPGDDLRDTVFVYWNQGFAAAPPVVEMCRRALAEHTGRTVELLDDDAVRRLVAVPYGLDGLPMGHAHRSDLLRLELLRRYGGTWLDATCLVGPGIDELLDLRSRSGFFALSKRGVTLSNWLMSAVPGHYLVALTSEAVSEAWRHFGGLTHYFMFHHVFESLVTLDERCAALWRATPKVPSDGAHALKQRMFARYDADELDRILAASPVHKLTYKLTPQDARRTTMIGGMLARRGVLV